MRCRRHSPLRAPYASATFAPLTAICLCIGGLVRQATPAAADIWARPPHADENADVGISRPRRVVSLNLCADQLVVMLVEPERVAALSKLARDPVISHVAPVADAYPSVQPHAENVLALHPDIVLAGRYTAKPAVDFIRSKGVRIVTLSLLSNFEAIREQTRMVGTALGVPRRAEALIAKMDAMLDAEPAGATAGRRPVALSWQPGGFTAGGGTLTDAVFQAAGFDNLAAREGLEGYGYLTLETVVAGRPDVLIADGGPPETPSLRQALLAHPALRPTGHTDRDGSGVGRRVALPTNLLTCAGPFTADAVRLLRATRGELTR